MSDAQYLAEFETSRIGLGGSSLGVWSRYHMACRLMCLSRLRYCKGISKLMKAGPCSSACNGKPTWKWTCPMYDIKLGKTGVPQ